jgi:hypothetical protein
VGDDEDARVAYGGGAVPGGVVGGGVVGGGVVGGGALAHTGVQAYGLVLVAVTALFVGLVLTRFASVWRQNQQFRARAADRFAAGDPGPG